MYRSRKSRSRRVNTSPFVRVPVAESLETRNLLAGDAFTDAAAGHTISMEWQDALLSMWQTAMAASESVRDQVASHEDGGPVFASENEPPTIISPTRLTHPENLLTVTDVESIDLEDAEGNLTYTLDGPDELLFSIDAFSGVIEFLAAPDFESPVDSDSNNVYLFNVSVTDSGNLSDTESFAITVSNVITPVFLTPIQLQVPENSRHVVDLEIVTEQSDDVTFTIVGGSDGGGFGIDRSTGELTFHQAKDFETPDDNSRDNIYDVKVRVEDAAGRTTFETFFVEITNVNEAPTLLGSPFVLTNEHTLAVVDFSTDDPDDSENDGLLYTITGGIDEQHFGLNSITGELTFIDEPDAETPLDDNQDNIYEIQITVTDAAGLFHTVDFLVFLKNVTAPVFLSDASVSVLEHTLDVIDVEMLADEREGEGPTYSLSGPDADKFSIDPTSGQIVFLAEPDFEAPADLNADNIYNVQVKVVLASFVDSTQDLEIKIQDVTSPIIPTPEFIEHIETTTEVVDVHTISDDVEDGALTYSISGGEDQALFTVDPVSGMLSFLAAPDFEAAGDIDQNNRYHVQVSVVDALQRSTFQDFSVTVTDLVFPIFTSPAGYELPENAPFVVDLQVISENAEGEGLGFEISGGPDAATFVIDPITGRIDFVNAPDFETPGDQGADNIYQLEVSATDASQLTTLHDLTINVFDLNEQPRITSPTEVTIYEHTILAIDIETDDPEDRDSLGLTYAITGGADQDLFTINDLKGILEFNSDTDFETPIDADADNRYEIEVTVTDSGQLTFAQFFVIQVADVVAPVVTTPTAIGHRENRMEVVDIESLSEDGEGAGILYSLSGGDDHGLFTIDAETGQIRFMHLPDFEIAADANRDNIYELQVLAQDSGGSTTKNLEVTIRDVPDAFPRIQQVLVQSDLWSDAFKAQNLSETDGFYPIALSSDLASDGAATSIHNLPWSIDSIRIQFDRDVEIDPGSIVITGREADYQPTWGFFRCGRCATWRVNSITQDKLMLNLPDTVVDATTGWALDGEFKVGLTTISGDGQPGGVFNFPINVLAGDVDGNGLVAGSDLVPIRSAFEFDAQEDGYDIRADLNGDAVVSGDDLISLRTFFGNQVLAMDAPAVEDFLTPERPVSERVSQLPLGINPGKVTYFEGEVTYADITRATEWHSDWVTRTTPIPLNSEGSPRAAIPFDDGNGPVTLFAIVPAHTDLDVIDSDEYFKLVLTGNVSVSIQQLQTGERFSCEGGTCEFFIKFNPNVKNAVMEIDSARPGAKWNLYLPGYDENSGLFHSAYTDALTGFQTVRNLNWTRTNASPQVHWTDRTRPQAKSQGTDYGTSYEHFVALTNQIGAAPWITIPHQVTNHYVRELATLLKGSVDEDQPIYVEYSNEVWNIAPQFEQSHYATEQGKLLFPREPNDGDAAYEVKSRLKFYAKRSAEVFEIFDEVFNDPNVPGNHDGSSLVKTLAWQAANSFWGRVLVEQFHSPEINPNGVQADSIAIAPYLSIDLRAITTEVEQEVLLATDGFAPEVPNPRTFTNAQIDMVRELLSERYSGDIIVDQLLSDAIPQSAGWISQYKTLADEYNLDLVAYEGGQHLIPPPLDAATYPHWEEMMYEANRNPRMKEVYYEYHRMWFHEGGGMHAGLGFVQIPRSGAAFGLMEFLGEFDAPKWQATIDLMFEEAGECIADGSCLDPFGE